MKIRLSSSKISSILSCPYKTYLGQKFEPIKKSSALLHGSIWHKIMEVYYSHVRDSGYQDISGAILAAGAAAKAEWVKAYDAYDIWEDYRDFQTEMEMLTQYIATYKETEELLEVVGVEEKFEILIPVSQKAQEMGVEEITYSGIIDLRCKMNGISWLIDHKTTSMSPTKEAEKLNRSLQFIGYAYAERELYGEAEGFISNFASCSSRKKKDGTYGKKTVSFHRSPQLYTEEDFEVFKDWVNFSACLVVQCETLGYKKNYASCYGYGRCSQYTQCGWGEKAPVDGMRVLSAEEAGSPLVY